MNSVSEMYIDEQIYNEFMNVVYEELDYDEDFIEVVSLIEQNPFNMKPNVPPIHATPNRSDTYILKDKLKSLTRNIQDLENSYKYKIEKHKDKPEYLKSLKLWYTNSLSKITDEKATIISKINDSTKSSYKSVATSIGDALKGTKDSIVRFFTNNYKIIGITALVALVAVGSYKIYKHYKSKNKELAITNAKRFVSAAESKCSQSKDPAACKAKLKALSNKWDSKKKKLKETKK